MESWLFPLGFVVGTYCLTWILNSIIPGQRARGSAKDHQGKQLEYKLNGLACVLVGSMMLYGSTLILPPLRLDFAITHFRQVAIAACVIGVMLSILMYVVADFWPNHVSAHTESQSVMSKFFLGTELNPRWLGVDIKMWLYLAGVFMLIINVVSAAAFCYGHSAEGHGLPPLFVVYASEMLWFCFDYLVFEHVQLTTYDLFAENVGFKLTWGCLFFYPYGYCVGMWPFIISLSSPENDIADIQSFQLQPVVSLVLFFTGWMLSRGANLQKYAFKTSVLRNSKNKFFFLRQETIAGKLLVSGFWGLSRHINYLGEILMAVGMALCGGLPTYATMSYWTLLPWIYPLYYVLLLVTRERDDNRRCAKKYGSLWSVYEKRVPHRIIPYIY